MAEEKEEILTREDVLKRIEENGGTAEGLDLSGKRFEEGIDLRELNLKGIILTGAYLEGADLSGAHLEGARLWHAHLERATLQHAHLERAELVQARLEEVDLLGAHLEGAELDSAHLEGAGLLGTDLEGAYLTGAYLEGANLIQVKLAPDTGLEDVHWGNYILREEKTADFEIAVDSYRRLKQWYTNAGMYDVAAEFYYREMEAKRKCAQGEIREHFKKSKGCKFLHFLFKENDFGNWVRLCIYRLTCGYGERPWQVFLIAATIIFGLAGLYTWLGSFVSKTFLGCLYYSAASFTALGYGNWAPQPSGWAKGMGAAEAVVGVLMIALFLVTFTRKMIR